MDRRGEPFLRMVGITKTFPGVVANDNVTLEVGAGEIHGLLGENGAGKTTLMNILYGLHHPDAGEIYLNGRKVEITSPRAAIDLGIGMVHQHFMLVDNLTALENVILGLPSMNKPVLDLKSARARFEKLAQEYDLSLDPLTPVWQLPVGDQQWLEILRLLFRDVRLLILDEPTAVLAPSQVRKLFQTMRRLAEEGRSIIFISHKLEEMREIADRVTVLRDGRVIGTVDPREASPSQLARMMVGRDVFLDRRPRPPSRREKPVLVIEHLSCLDDRGSLALNDLSLRVFAGEIVGVAGVDGNGQRELAECIAGLRRPIRGKVYIAGVAVSGVVDPSLLGFIPEDRRKTGLALDLSVAENLILKTFDDTLYSRYGLLRWDTIRHEASDLINQYRIKTPDARTPVRYLSGGNQQRVVIARELSRHPPVVVASQPTRGLDLGAVEGVHEVLLEARNRGAAVLFISTELPEVLALSDRIVVLFKGQIMGELDAETADVELIGEMMLGYRGGAAVSEHRGG